ncbi:hypothetical protein [Desulfofarcimen acetoxidans]|uniref:hypothetical protein n=1 Tax=Desulfofarcimen acetoxidans TaxID=58138 RepID=UPI00019E5A3D|nr:hypothetical protein [Desulfofarcimen acetoxidans]
MDNIKAGGSAPEKEKSGEAIMCAYISISCEYVGEGEDEGKRLKVTGSGALYDSIPSFINVLKKPFGINSETWRLSGIDDQTAKKINGKLCWISGNRILVYRTNPIIKKKYLVDQYFAVNNWLTREEFNQALNQTRELIGEGGV